MSVYNRKGGKGKSGSLREQFNYYKKQVINRLVKEQAFKQTMSNIVEPVPKTLIESWNFDEIYNQGITRKVKNKTIRYVGEEAIKIQIESFRFRASKTKQSQAFIDNYLNTMIEVGFENDNVIKVEKLLNSISIDKLTYIINRGILPSIRFLYDSIQNEDEVLKDIENSVKFGWQAPKSLNIREKINVLKNQKTKNKSEIQKLTKLLNKINRDFWKSLKIKSRKLEKPIKTIFKTQGFFK